MIEVASKKKLSSLRIMGPSGDLKLTWNAESIPEIQKARDKFNEYMAKKKPDGSKVYRAYKVDDISGSKKGEEIFEFDPNVERIVLVGQMVGG